MRALIAFLIFVCSLPAAAEDPAGAPPKWFLDEIRTLADGTGRWIADNSPYISEDEPYEAYGTEWKSSFDGTSMTGRLFGLKGGEEVGTFWEFRQFWHPGEKRAVVEQFGWGGVYGVGPHWREGDGTKSDQTFYATDGSARRTGHVSSFPDAETHLTESFDILGDEWTPRRRYIWKRQPQD